MNDSHDHSIAAEVGRHVLAFAGAMQPLQASLRIKLTSNPMDDVEYHIVAAKSARGIVLSKEVSLLGVSATSVLGFPNDADADILSEFIALDSAARDPAKWSSREFGWGLLLQHDMQVLAPTVANSLAVARWFESLVANQRDWKPSQPHRLPYARTRGGHTLTLDAVSLSFGGTDHEEQSVMVAGGLYCEPLAPPPPAPVPPVAVRLGPVAPPAVQFAYEDEPLPSAWTLEQCAAFDARCAGYHARTARVGARVAQLVGAWHAVPMTLG